MLLFPGGSAASHCPPCPGLGSQVSSSSPLVSVEEKGRIKCRNALQV